MTKEKDLIWLVWLGTDLLPDLTKETPKDVTVDMANGNWTFRSQTIEFGRAVTYPWEEKGTPLGVFDRMDLEQVKMMLIGFNRLAPPRWSNV